MPAFLQYIRWTGTLLLLCLLTGLNRAHAQTAADLATVLAVPASAAEGSLVYYTATTTNNGPGTVSPVITITLPGNLTGISTSDSGTRSYSTSTGNTTITYPAASVAVNSSISRNVAFRMPAASVVATVSGTATATATNNTDPVPNNNSSSASTARTQLADVSVAVKGPTRIITNQVVTYTVVPTNLGPSTAVGVVLQAQLPTGLSNVVVSDQGAYNSTTGIATWSPIATLASGSQSIRTVRFNSPMTVPSPNTIVITAAGTSSTANGDPVAANNDGSQEGAKITTQVVTLASTLLCASSGTDGTPTAISSAGVNTYFPGVGTASAGATSLTVGAYLGTGASTPIAAGDLVLIMQMQGTDINSTNTNAYGDGVAEDETMVMGIAAGSIAGSGLTAGTYEYAIANSAVSTAGGTLTLKSGLLSTYATAAATAASGTTTAGQKRYQVIRVPQYQDLTLTANLTAPYWNGQAGGVLALDVQGTLDFAGKKISMRGRGFRGGGGQKLTGSSSLANTAYRFSTTVNNSGNKGEGIAGTPRYVNDTTNVVAFMASPQTSSTVYLDTRTATTAIPAILGATLTDGYPAGDRARGAPGNAGGGGTDASLTNNSQNAGGGGGSNAGSGGMGGNSWSSNSPLGGFGGADFTQANAGRVIMGGGGGAGTNNDGTVGAAATYPLNAGLPSGTTDGSGFTASGAAGGGIVLIRAQAVSANAGIIDVSGADANYVALNDGSGGGGAGGSVILLCNASNGDPTSTVLQNIRVLAKGGKGGSNTGGGSPHGPGGGGSGGMVFASSPINAASLLTPGVNGTTYGSVAYGASAGTLALGQVQSTLARAAVPNVVDACPADVITTLSTSATSANAGAATPVVFTITTINVSDASAANIAQTVTLGPALATVLLNGAAATATTNGVATYASGATYNTSTGVVTFPTVATLAGYNSSDASTTLTNTISFTMPTQNVVGQAAATSTGDLDPRTANNDGSLPAANVKVTANNQITGIVYDDVNYGGGAGRPYATANAAAVAAGLADGAIGSPGTTVELYDATGTFAQGTTTGSDGSYGFSSLTAGATYTVRVVNATVKAARGNTLTGLLPVQTFRVSSDGTNDLNRVGGEAPEKVDAAAGTSGTTLAALNTTGTSTTAGTVAQSQATVALGATPVTGINFGFNFDLIVNTNDFSAGTTTQGSLRQFIVNANALPNGLLDQAASSYGGPDPAATVETSIFMIPNGTARQGQVAGLVNQLSASGVAIITPTSALPALANPSGTTYASNTVLDGTTQTLNIGNTNATTLGTGGTVGTAGTALGTVAGPEVALVGTQGQTGSDYGLTLNATNLTVQGLAMYGFGNTGATGTGNANGANIFVTGAAISGTLIQNNVLGTAATTFTDPGPSQRTTGHGVLFKAFTSGATVSGAVLNNLIGYHGAAGVENLANATATTLITQGNEIRANALLSPTADGVHLGNNGGVVQANLIADNKGPGIDLDGSIGSATITGNTIRNNGLGGTETPGIRAYGTANTVSLNSISGHTLGSGILVRPGSTVSTIAGSTTISQNVIFDNKLLAIDLLNNGENEAIGTSPYLTANDLNDYDGRTDNISAVGGNGLLNFPVMTNATITSSTSSGGVLVTGFARPGSRIELYATGTPSTSGFGEGRTYLGYVLEGTTQGGGLVADTDTGTGTYAGTINGVNQGTDNTNQFSFLIPFSSLPAGVLVNGALPTTTVLSSTATLAKVGTSEFSGNTPVSTAPLPVTLTAFTAQALGQDARLNWQTAQELHNSYFAVERSFDGRRFAEVGRVASQGTGMGQRTYAFTDAGVGRLVASQSAYYRLRQVDADGTTAFSSVQAVPFATVATAAVYPNPASGTVTLSLLGLPQGPYAVRVLDAVGRVVYTTSALGATAQPLPADAWPRGTYLIQVVGPSLTKTLRLERY